MQLATRHLVRTAAMLAFGLPLMAPRVCAQQDFVEDVIAVKFTPAAARVVGRSGGGSLSGLASLDRLNRQYRAAGLRRIFRPAGRHEARHAAWRLDRWYYISFIRGTDVRRAVAAYAADPAVEVAELRRPIQPYGSFLRHARPEEIQASALAVPNDPQFGAQWHFHNTGQSGGTPDADIDLPEAHDTHRGSPQVIVQVIDTGIDTDHPDLAGALWTNPGEVPGNVIDDDNNGYVDDVHGYSHVDDTAVVEDGVGHGTHTAGTIGARLNNAVGVAGIAGGDGTPASGVRLMISQIFNAAQQGGGAAEAFVYGADNGAAISSNSWGYTAPGTFDQHVLEAIDYFVANAGSAPGAALQGGLVVFAAGNSNSSADFYPAFYGPTVAVAATGHDDRRAYYSNYGTWVDLAAPGGDQLSGGQAAGVLSTLPGGYGFFQGTSMACPHVAGTAALVAAHAFAGGTVLTAEQLRAQIASAATTDPLDARNPVYAGLLGVGRLNAHKALHPPPPDISVSPGQLSFQLAEGERAEAILTVGNAGEGPLHWHVAATADPFPASAAPPARARSYEARYFEPLAKGAPDARTGHLVAESRGGPDGYGYRWIDSREPGGPPFAWFDIAEIGTPLPLGDEDVHAVALPFMFSFYGRDNAQVWISANGYLTFSGEAPFFGFVNFPIPFSLPPNDMICPFWTDLNPGAGGAVHYYHDAANRRFVVQYTDVPHYSAGGAMTFQVLLYEAGHLIVQYQQMNGPLDWATVGVENPDGSDGLEIAFNTAYVADRLAVLITPSAPWLSVSPAAGTIPAGGSMPVTVAVDATGLAAGSYGGLLTVLSDDPDEPRVEVPVTLVVHPPDEAQAIGEAGRVRVSQPAADQWHAVGFSRSYSQPVVVMQPPSYEDAQPATVRVRAVTSSGFEFQIDEWDYLDGVHGEETIGYAVVEAGVHTLPDGRLVQAGLVEASSQVITQPFAQAFATPPIVLSQVTTTHDARAVVTRQRNISGSAFSLYLQGQESNRTHAAETVAWIALARGVGSCGENTCQAGLTPDAVTHQWRAISFQSPFSATPVFLAAMQRADGGDTAGLRFRGLTASRVAVRVEEERSKDKETNHTTESVGYLVLEAGPISTTTSAVFASRAAEQAVSAADVGSERSGSTGASPGAAAALAERYVLEGNYPNPFNPQTTIRYGLAGPVHVRLEVFDLLGRRVALLVDAVQPAGTHAAVFNAGALPGSLYLYRLRAGAFEETRKMVLAK